MWSLLAAALVGLSACEALGSRTRVEKLPGYGAPPTTHWTGFVPTDSKSSSTLFYYLVESEGNPSTDPLIWWMNGGPGASSLIGLVTETGPVLLAATSTGADPKLYKNAYSWNERANVLYVEFAPGIGYSFCHNSTQPASSTGCAQASGDCSPCEATDSTVAEQNVALLKALLAGTQPDGSDALFPELKGRPLYLAGESYAGVYVPTLAAAIVESFQDTSIANLHGLWVTDPCTDNEAQFGWLDMSINFCYEKGLISLDTFETLSSKECTVSFTAVGDRVREVRPLQCRHAWRLYDLATAGLGDAVFPLPIPGIVPYVDPLFSEGFVGGPDPEAYFNSESVRQALNTSYSPNTVYHVAIGNNGYPQYRSEYAACNLHPPANAQSMIDVYEDLVNSARLHRHHHVEQTSASNLKTILISSGVLDPVVAMHGTEAAVKKIGFEVVPGGNRRPYFYNASATPSDVLETKPFAWGPSLAGAAPGVQVGGFVTSYDTNSDVELHFVTVRNSGHMVPAYRPQLAKHILQSALLDNNVLSPTLPTGWDTASDDEFYARNSTTTVGIFASWVEKAQKLL